MAEPFYEKAGSLISPGDVFSPLPYIRVPKPLRVARKVRYSLPRTFKLQGELREILELGKHAPDPDFNFSPPGEEILANAKMSMAVFLTWGSEVEDDQRRGKLHKKDWLIAPVFPLAGLEELKVVDARSGETFNMAEAARAGRSPRFFALRPFPGEESPGYYVDFRKICPLAANHFQDVPRQWRLAPAALNDFYHQLIWFLTRREIFFRPISCPNCGQSVDLGVVFEGQPTEPEDEP